MSDRYDSTDEQRTEVGNATRHQYRTLTDEEKVCMNAIKAKGEAFINDCTALKDMRPECGREYALAITKMEEAVMWAVKGLTT